jgi:hypothetical protein
MQEGTKQELKALGGKVSIEVVESMFKILEIEITASENTYDNLLIPFLPLAKGKLLEVLKKELN